MSARLLHRVGEEVLTAPVEPRLGDGGHEELYRVRQGRYRIVYTVEDHRLVVLVIRVTDRKEVYRKMGRAPAGQRSRPFGSSS